MDHRTTGTTGGPPLNLEEKLLRIGRGSEQLLYFGYVFFYWKDSVHGKGETGVS